MHQEELLEWVIAEDEDDDDADHEVSEDGDGEREGNKQLTQFQGGKMKREEEAEKRWMKDFWKRMETVQKVWGG